MVFERTRLLVPGLVLGVGVGVALGCAGERGGPDMARDGAWVSCVLSRLTDPPVFSLASLLALARPPSPQEGLEASGPVGLSMAFAPTTSAGGG